MQDLAGKKPLMFFLLDYWRSTAVIREALTGWLSDKFPESVGRPVRSTALLGIGFRHTL